MKRTRQSRDEEVVPEKEARSALVEAAEETGWMKNQMESAERTWASTLTAHNESASTTKGRIRSGEEDKVLEIALLEHLGLSELIQEIDQVNVLVCPLLNM